ncbi:MAG: hypothetical protein CR997_00865 [Acidobacteria bacterium]|nr:MAG: hypothetical protein CR997_00865 [Acidobacteriota bacterium]
MFVLTLLFLSFNPDNNWQLEDPELFNDVFVLQVGLNDAGIYILNTSGYCVQHYDYSGKKIRTFGKRGDGPGEFREPYFLQVLPNQVVVYELNRAHEFNNSGKLMHTTKFPVGNSQIKRVKHGWLGIENLLDRYNDKPINVLFYKGSTKKNICEIERMQTFDDKIDNTDRSIRYNPTIDYGDFFVDLTGQYAYIRVPGSTNVFVFDSNIEDILLSFEIPGKPIKFNKDWGNMRLETMNKLNKNKYVANFPAYFPVVARMNRTIYNEINVLKYTPLPSTSSGESNLDILPLTLLGQERNMKQSDTELFMRRSVGIHNNYIYWIAYDDESDSYTIKRTEKSKFTQSILLENRLPAFCRDFN